MNPIASGFVTLCILLIAGSVGLLLVIAASFTVAEAAAVAMGLLVIMVTFHFQIMRRRDSDMQMARYEDLTDQISEMLDDLTNFRLRLEEIEKSVGEKAKLVADSRAKVQMRPLMTEQEILGELIKQMAESAAGLDDRLTLLEHWAAEAESPQAVQAPVLRGPSPATQEPTHVVPQPATESVDLPPVAPSSQPAPQPGEDQVNAAPVEPMLEAPEETKTTTETEDKTSPPALKDNVDEGAEEEPEDGLSDKEIRTHIRENRLTLYLQAIMSLPQRQIKFYEAFARFDTKAGAIPAADFIHSATRLGLVPAIDNLMVYRAADLVRRLRERTPDVGVFCNLSPASLADSRFFDGLANFLDDNRDLKGHLFFEFTQADFENFSPIDEGNFEAIREIGFGFSIDQVDNLQADFRRYGQNGVRFIKTSAQVLLSALENKKADIHPADLDPLLQRFDIDLIVDKIESEDQNVELLDYSARFGQGLLLAPPKPVRTEAAHAKRGIVDARRRAAQ